MELDEVKNSQIIRIGLAFLMSIPEAANNVPDHLIQENDQIMAKIKKIIKKHPVPELNEQWEKLMANLDQMYSSFEKSAEKFSPVVGDGKKGRKPDPYKKHTPGRIPKREIEYKD